jgi:hypothetical protein
MSAEILTWRTTRYSPLVRIGMRKLMDETDEKSIRPLRFGVAGRKLIDHGCLPLVKVVVPAYHGFGPYLTMESENRVPRIQMLAGSGELRRRTLEKRCEAGCGSAGIWSSCWRRVCWARTIPPNRFAHRWRPFDIAGLPFERRAAT